MDAEKEQQCLAAGVACRYPAYAVVLFLIAETTLHVGRAQSADYPSCGAYVGILFLWLRAFAYKAGRYAVFGAVPPVVVVGNVNIDNICTEKERNTCFIVKRLLYLH